MPGGFWISLRIRDAEDSLANALRIQLRYPRRHRSVIESASSAVSYALEALIAAEGHGYIERDSEKALHLLEREFVENGRVEVQDMNALRNLLAARNSKSGGDSASEVPLDMELALRTAEQFVKSACVYLKSRGYDRNLKY